jgi:hypothetical protein
MNAPGADERSDQPAKPDQTPPSPKRGAFPTPRSVIDQAAEYRPEQQATDGDHPPTTASDAAADD